MKLFYKSVVILALLNKLLKAARDVGLALLETMGDRPKNKGNAYYLMNIISKSHIFITYHYHVAIDDTFTM